MSKYVRLGLCYQLQKIDLPAIERSHFDVIVIDYSSDGSDAGAFTRAQIGSVRHGTGDAHRSPIGVGLVGWPVFIEASGMAKMISLVSCIPVSFP